MTITEMKERKKELGYSNREIAELSGLPLGTVMKIFSGATTSPRRASIESLSRLLDPAFSSGNNENTLRHDTAHFDTYELYSDDLNSDNSLMPAMLREPEVIYGSSARKLYTLDDYYTLPDDIRVELIDGVFYDMAAPTTIHQDIIGRIYAQLLVCSDAHPDTCRVLVSPVDVQLEKDEFTMVQPDIIAVCDLMKLGDNKKCFGAPDLAVEVTSPSSRSKDAVLKLHKYRVAGVREFWLVDPERMTVTVYILEKNQEKSYTFDDHIPVFISGGSCEIDFGRIKSAVFR